MKRKMILLLLLGLFLVLPYKANAIDKQALTHLEVETNEGVGNFDLTSGKTTFSFKLYSSVDYANIIAKAANESYTITGAGKVECKEGMNQLSVVVTDPSDNSSQTYTINLEFVKSAVSDGKTNPNTGAFVNYSLLGVGLIGTAILLTKKKKLFNK